MASKQQGEGAGLAHWVGGVVEVITSDGRIIKGIFRGYDQVTNVILEECCELVFSTATGVQMAELGLQIVRGDNIAVIGEVDEDLYDSLDLDSTRAAPLKTISH